MHERFVESNFQEVRPTVVELGELIEASAKEAVDRIEKYWIPYCEAIVEKGYWIPYCEAILEKGET
jgi:hypothetical protein